MPETRTVPESPLREGRRKGCPTSMEDDDVRCGRRTRSRRRFLAMLPGAALGLVAGAGPLAGAVSRGAPVGRGRRGRPSGGASEAGARPGRPPRARRHGGHPDPRPGIDASKIPPGEALEGWPRAIEVFDRIREIPEIVDGIACQCGCRENPDYYSFLSCFEGEEPMARWCPGCQKLGRFVADLADEGKSLDEIRAAVDAGF